jgi:hypothetical protein
MIQKTDISLVLSGGSSNADPANSLGGDPSNVAIPSGINNLFADASDTDAQLGRVDYRCFYVFNDNPTDVFKSVKVWVDSEIAAGATVQLGINAQDDLQIIAVTGNVSGGSLALTLDGSPFSFAFNNDLAVWGQNLQNALNGLSSVSGASVSVAKFGTTVTFQIVFQGDDSNRYFTPLVLTTNSLTGVGSIVVSLSKLVDGSPINSIAPAIDQSTTVPVGVNFVNSDSESFIPVGNLRALEGFPVWVKRTIAAETDPIGDDGFSLGLSGNPIQ